ncbi:Uncharacterized protein OS=Candidatus Entotheonella sp. TSY1 GN=ETSY1_21010 PE=4 SV=1: DUF4276 [Gemmata massiliana]|uniref:DUF4276 family protein n=1 Tax=Gemmata massiliana TaxID=1210884 RepID=A0A6P2CZR7_9BACT|nr:DUF4276 family protein [Gemmata massiliana]VTR92662.1 Uncharacterized protein OS=Candidatus Entotheonella sp. TSY1 GN=ETSY1_21010 PE=4 SV=1: DUF4276 [Gemmata massiliana]
MTLYIAPVVEGHTEQGCVEGLLYRIWTELLCRPERLQVIEPFRTHRDSLTHPNGEVLSDTVQKAYLKLRAKTRKDPNAIALLLILLDAEKDCPAALAPRLVSTAKQALPTDAPIACVLAKQMFENWIVAGASALGGVNELPDTLPHRPAPEDCNGAGWLDGQLRIKNKGRKYKKTVDAELFVRSMALQECRDCAPSFDKLCRELEARLPPAPSLPPLADAPTE